MGLQRRINETVQEMLPRGESLVAAVAVVDPARAPPLLFGAHKVFALTTERLLLLNYYGTLQRHAERRAAYDRNSVAGTLTKICGLRFLRIERGPGANGTYRSYIRCSRSADVLGRFLEEGLAADLAAFKQHPGEY